MVGDVAALVEGLKDLLAELGRHARSLVFDHQQDAVVVGLQPDPDGRRWRGVPGRVDEQVLDDPLQLGSIGGQAQRRGIDHHRVLVLHAGVRHHPVDEGAEVDQLAARDEGAAGEPVQIQQVAEEPIKLAGVARQPMQQVGQVAGGQAGGAVLQGEGDAKDGGQGRAEVVGDGERNYGRGRIVASTFRLFQDAPMADPTATVLLDSLIALTIENHALRLEEAVRAAEFAA